MPGGGRSVPKERPYKIYTTEFDEEIASLALALANAVTPRIERAGFDAIMATFAAPSPFRTALEAAIGSLADVAVAPETHVTFLVDHSGSMKGESARAAAVIVDVATAYLAARGAAYEVLGYTTRNWRGGRARARWRRTLQLGRPGRLCELRHIVYGDDTSSGDWRATLGLLLVSDVLRDGVDGEALRWAERRMDLDGRPANRLLVQIGDCSPADPATDQANEKGFLEADFLKTAIGLTERADLAFGVLTFVPWIVDGFRQFPLRKDPEDRAGDVVSALRSLLTGQNPPAITSLFPEG